MRSYLFLFFLICFISCKNKEKEVLINGDLSNLPDGIMYLSKDNYLNKIDSVNTINGRFIFKYDLEKKEPIYLALHHVDKKGVFRAISFPTNAKYNNSGYYSQFFLSDSIVIINGNLVESNPIGIKHNPKTKFVNTQKIKGGYQTNALLHSDGDLFDNIEKETYIKVMSKIKEYPNSFHLLYQINNNKNSFTASEIENLLSLFRGEIVNSQTYKTLKEYNQKRFNSKKLILPMLTNDKGKKIEILNTKFKIHLVVFWASWCGPCRQEIPALKNMYSKYKDEVEFVSISTDENNSSWLKALMKEEMSWKQLIVSEKSNDFEPIEIFFQLSNSIPYIALVDNNMKVLKSHVGLMTDTEMENFIKN